MINLSPSSTSPLWCACPEPHTCSPPHLLPIQPLPVPTASPARTSLARLRTGPSSKPSSAPPLAGACRRSSSRVGRPLRRRGPTPLFPTPPPAATRPLLSVPGHSPCPRPAVAPVRGHHRPYAFSRGLLSDTCTLHAAWSMPTASFYACVASAACCDSEAMRVPCVVRVVCTARRNRAG